jgi:hypothetical protein
MIDNLCCDGCLLWQEKGHKEQAKSVMGWTGKGAWPAQDELWADTRSGWGYDDEQSLESFPAARTSQVAATRVVYSER